MKHLAPQFAYLLIIASAVSLLTGCNPLAPPKSANEEASSPVQGMQAMGAMEMNSNYLITKLTAQDKIKFNVPITMRWKLADSETHLPLRNLNLIHEKPVHLIIVSRDLKSFQHLHPVLVSPA